MAERGLKHITTTRRDGKKVKRRIFGDSKTEAKQIMAEIKHGKPFNLENLRCDAIDVKPLDFDWSEHELGEDWECYECSVCDKCNVAVNTGVGGGEKHSDIDSESNCDGHVPQAEGPMMNYAYPLPYFVDNDGEGARSIAHLPVCLVGLLTGNRGEEEAHLALTGGGMDLSWEICEAYLTLGYYPPAHFCDLPAMSGRGESSKDKWIVAGCQESLRVLNTWLQRRAERLAEMMARAAKEQRARLRAARKEVQP